MDIPPQAGLTIAGLIILAAFLVILIWDRLAPVRRAARHGR